MCRNIQQLRGAEPPATEGEIRDAALQCVRKISGYRTPSAANAAAFQAAVDDVATAVRRLVGAVGGLLGDGGERAPSPRAPNGDGILRHVLGNRREAVEDGTARASGLDRGTVATLLVALAPMLMSALGKVKRERHLDEEGVVQLVESERQRTFLAVPPAINRIRPPAADVCVGSTSLDHGAAGRVGRRSA